MGIRFEFSRECVRYGGNNAEITGPRHEVLAKVKGIFAPCKLRGRKNSLRPKEFQVIAFDRAGNKELFLCGTVYEE